MNASAHELRHPQYVEEVLATLSEAGLPPSLLGVEITESMLVARSRPASAPWRGCARPG